MKHYKAHSSILFKDLKCLKLPDLIHYKILIILFKAKYQLLPENLHKYFVNMDSVHSYSTRSTSQGNFCHGSKTKLRQMCLSIKGVQIWNRLNADLKRISSETRFKNNLKRMFIEKY